ncbi:MAG: hypothetical protein Kow00127_10220 [Bacteroidales bacterium]
MLFAAILLQANAGAQVVINNDNLAASLEMEFGRQEVVIERGQIISNILNVANSSTDTLEFFITINQPPLWKKFFNENRKYSIAPSDTLYIPVRIIPGPQMKGDTKYYINAYLEDINHRPVSAVYFFASTRRISQWEIYAEQGNRIYFKNNQNEIPLDLTLLNTGNEKQDLLLTAQTANRNIILMDSTGRAIDDPTTDMTLGQGQDTTLHYKVKFLEEQRNFKTIDLENHNPASTLEEKQFSLFFHSEEPRREKYDNLSRNAKIDFIKLTHDKKVNDYGSDVLPLTAYLRVSNLMEDVVFSSLHLRGRKQFDNGGNLIYNTSLYFSSIDNFYGENYVRNIPWYIGYFDAHKNIQAGYVNGGAVGMQSSGKGVKGEIEFLPNHWAGAYYVRSPWFFNSFRMESFGFSHKYFGKNLSTQLQYAHSHHYAARMITDIISASPRFRLAGKHTINAFLSLSNRKSYLNPVEETRQGYMAGLGYTSAFFNNIWRLNLRGSYTSKGFGAYGYERIFLNHRSRIRATGDLEISVINNYNRYNYDTTYYAYIPGFYRNYYSFNSVNFHSAKYLGNTKPGLFYDIRNHMGYNFHVRGLNFSFNNYKMESNLQTSLITSFGFSRIMNEPGKKEHFVTRINSMIRYRNFSFTGYYNYGPLSPAMVQLKMLNDIIPQTLRTSFMHMYMFGNRHVVLQSRLSYMYTNVYNHHSLNVSPELFYFTNNSWRFSINPTFTFYSSKMRVDSYDLPSYVTVADYDFRRYSNDNFLISFGVKKDFGIPIPATSDKYTTTQFKAFYDVNGNKIQDDDEPGIGNVVITAGNWSVITRPDGSASLQNIPPGRYSFGVMALEDLQGWFPLVSDSLNLFRNEPVNIPFVKGVKVMGSVFVEQEIVNPLEEKKLDVSGIKITAANGYTFQTLTGSDGSFEFYLPFGKYTITLDEKILNGRFYLVKNNYELDLSDDVENMYITFHIIEKKRKIRIKKF